METPKTHVNVKLHGYLRKALSESDYKRLCTPSCEPAMVETEQESRVHKYVFFSDALLYLLDHSMKGQPIVLCAVEDILQIKHTQNLPSFLSKKDAEKTVHVQVTYKRKSPPDRPSLMSRSPAILKKVFNKERKSKGSCESLDSIGRGSLERDLTMNLSYPPPSVISATSPSVISATPPSVISATPPSVISATPPAVISATPPSTTYGTPSTSRSLRRSISPLCQTLTSLSVHSSPTNSSDGSIPISNPNVTKQTQNMSSISESYSSSVKPHEALSTSVKRGHSADFAEIFTNRTPSSSPRTSTSSLYRSGQLAGSRDSLQSLDSTGSAVSMETLNGERCVKADFYILNSNTSFYKLLNVVWVERQLSLTEEMCEGSIMSSSSLKTQEKLRSQYQQLCCDVLMTTSVQEHASLLKELCTACRKYPEIKLFFWEEDSLLNFSIKLLTKHFPSHNAENSHTHRADQLEVSIIVLLLLYHMSRGTHFSTHKCKQLESNNGLKWCRLVDILMEEVETKPVSSSVAEQDEIEKLCCEATQWAVCLLSDLASSIQCGQWLTDHQRHSFAWFVQYSGKHKNSVEFFRRVLSRCYSLLRTTSLLPNEVVFLHHMISHMTICAIHSKEIRQLFETHFQEEMKYYLRTSTSQKVISGNFLLKQRIVDNLHKLKSLTIDK